MKATFTCGVSRRNLDFNSTQWCQLLISFLIELTIQTKEKPFETSPKNVYYGYHYSLFQHISMGHSD